MKFGDIIYLSDEKDKKYVILSTKETNDKTYALITEFNAEINFKEKSITNANIDLSRAILIAKNNFNGEITFESDKNIILELCKIFFRDQSNQLNI